MMMEVVKIGCNFVCDKNRGEARKSLFLPEEETSIRRYIDNGRGKFLLCSDCGVECDAEDIYQGR